MPDRTRRQEEVLSDPQAMELYEHLRKGIEPATAAEMASDLDRKADGVFYDLGVLESAGLVERIPADDNNPGGFKAVEL